jgi:hypothetical protein
MVGIKVEIRRVGVTVKDRIRLRFKGKGQG